MTLRLDELANAIGVSREPSNATPRRPMPKPDLRIGKMPLWRVETIRAGSNGVATDETIAPRCVDAPPPALSPSVNGELAESQAVPALGRSVGRDALGRSRGGLQWLPDRPSRPGRHHPCVADQDPTGPAPPVGPIDPADGGDRSASGSCPRPNLPAGCLAPAGALPGGSRRRVDRLPGRFPRGGDLGRRLGNHRPIRLPADQARLLRIGIALCRPHRKPIKRQVASPARGPGSGLVYRGKLHDEWRPKMDAWKAAKPTERGEEPACCVSCRAILRPRPLARSWRRTRGG